MDVGTNRATGLQNRIADLPLVYLRYFVTIGIVPSEGLAAKSYRVYALDQAGAFHLIEAAVTDAQNGSTATGYVYGQAKAGSKVVPGDQIARCRVSFGREQIRESQIGIAGFPGVEADETVEAQTQVQRKPPANSPRVLQVGAGVMEVGLCGEGSVKRYHFYRIAVIVDCVDSLVHRLDVRVVVVAPFEAELRLCVPAREPLYQEAPAAILNSHAGFEK